MLPEIAFMITTAIPIIANPARHTVQVCSARSAIISVLLMVDLVKGLSKYKQLV